MVSSEFADAFWGALLIGDPKFQGVVVGFVLTVGFLVFVVAGLVAVVLSLMRFGRGASRFFWDTR